MDSCASLPWWRVEAELPCPARRDDLQVQVLGDEALFTDPRTQTTYRLNRTALLFWDRLDPSRSTRQVSAAIAAEYDVPAHRVQDDLEQVLALLADQGLIDG